MQGATEGIYKSIWDKYIHIESNLVKNHIAGLAKAKENNYVYLGEKGGVAPIVYKDCDYVMGKEEFFPSSFAFVFPENSSYLQIFNKR